MYRDPKLLGHIYAAPYALFAPELALIVEDNFGVGGYIVGALDTTVFEQILEEKWWPALRASHADMSADLVGVTAGDDVYAWQAIHHPDRAPDWLVEHHPSHLHINLLPRLQGGGYGGRLLRAWIERARELGSTGFHLGVSQDNARAARFYERQGLTRLFPKDGSDDGAIRFGRTISVG
ncbi:GNAT family N-acetyltransferase [Sphingomonas sp. 10B4]|uniref:GNAT family N-acetyltransferase n=1 Tax=Sphingomonas sp. 10B4 TaxID=3048575 RepID=UPI002AB34BF0|nr:GNAT family N-acetyltransferase [Sphingomonas sp. 10B4]MDY7524568.1 GNAT family N-acetyltransferase [Sphingomonas sp. 10B4]MEB0283986.1 GNAT family N-acetyltransferase [Sphingomonas sp. 10B4]